MRLNLAPPRFEDLNKALAASYDVFTFQRMLQFRLGLRMDHFASPFLPLDQIVFEVLSRAQQEGWTSELVLEAVGYQPKNAQIYEVAAALGLVPGATGQSQSEKATGAFGGKWLESLVDPAEGFHLLHDVLRALAERQRRVCRIEIGGLPKGTGFLVGPDRVITNHHVVAKVLAGGAAPADVKLRFDYWHKEKVGEPPSGVVFSLAGDTAEKAIPHHSPPTDEERAGNQNPTSPDSDHLDFALLMVAGSPGDAVVNAVHGATEPELQPAKRGWIATGDSPSEPEPDKTLIILQHPDGDPLSMAWNAPGVLAVNDKRTRVTYRNNTSPGSSGSPCFNGRLQLVALHHSGNLKGAAGTGTLGNEGIPIKAVVDALRQKGEQVAFKLPDP